MSATDREGARRQKVIDAARRLFVCKGFHNTSVAQIAECSGIFVGQIYRDFSSKDEIIAAIALHDVSRVLNLNALENAIAADDRPALQRWILEFVSADENIEVYELVPEIMAEALRNPKIARLLEDIGGKARMAIGKALATLTPDNMCAKTRSTLVDLILTLAGCSIQAIAPMAPYGDHKRLRDRLRAIVFSELEAMQNRHR